MGKGRYVAVVVAFVGAAVVAALWRFNPAASSYNQYIVGNLIGLMFIPMLTIVLVLRAEPQEFGLTLGSSRRAWALTGVLFAALVGVIWLLSRCNLAVVADWWEQSQNYYPLFRHYPEFGSVFSRYPAANPFDVAPMLMLYAELSYGLYLFWWEFFFRGFLLFGLFRSVGWPAVVIQAAAFTLLHLGKPPAEVVASFGAGVILGILALNAKSFVPCFVLHWAVSVSFDILVVAGRPDLG